MQGVNHGNFVVDDQENSVIWVHYDNRLLNDEFEWYIKIA